MPDPLPLILGRPRVRYDGPDAGASRTAGGPLRPVQAAALRAMEDTAGRNPMAFAAPEEPWGPRGILGLIGCGHGKTLILQLAPAIYLPKRPLVLVPNALKKQFSSMLRSAYADGYRVPSRMDVWSYESLSAPSGARALDNFAPDLLLLDEAHMVGNPDSARWKRIARYVQHNWRCRVVAVSGTLTDSSVQEMAHIAHLVLRDWSPIPIDHTLTHWSNVLDVGTEPSRDDTAYMARLATWAGEAPDRRGFRRAFRERLATSRGVVMTAGTSTNASLRIEQIEKETLSVEHTKALQDLDSLWTLPDGYEIVDALEHYRHASTLQLGFWNRYVDPVNPEWLRARSTWNSIARSLVQYAGFDSIGSVEKAIINGTLASRKAIQAFIDWRAVDGLEPSTETVWLPTAWAWLLARVADYLDSDPSPGLVWYRSAAVGSQLALHWRTHGVGSSPPDGTVHGIVSANVHGKGWNGQAYARQLVLQAPDNAAGWEQLLSRTHRPGQTRDVTARIYLHTPFLRLRQSIAMDGARYIEDMTGEPQRLLYADRVTL